MREVVRDLMCDLSDEELFDRAQQLSSTLQRYDEVELEKKNSNKRYSDMLGELGGEARKLSVIIRRRCESRPVCCAVMFHAPVKGSKRIVRTDTGEIVSDEPMTAAELQNNLFEDEPNQAALVGALDDVTEAIREGVVDSMKMTVGGETYEIDREAAERIHAKAQESKQG